MRRLTVAALLLALTISALAEAADPVRLVASLDRTQAAVGEMVRYQVTLEGGGRSLPDVQLPSFEGFDVISGPSVSTNVSWVMGEGGSTTKTITVVLAPLRAGRFELAPAEVTHRGKTYRSKPVILQSGGSTGEKPRTAVFLRARAEPARAYVGQGIHLIYELVTRVQVVGTELRSAPEVTGFWIEEIDSKEIPEGREEIDGVTFSVVRLATQVLFPTRSGTFALDPLTVVCRIPDESRQPRRRRRSLFDDPFFGGFGQPTKNVLCRSEPITLEVLPLPEEGRPPEFSGAVGELRLDARLDRRQVGRGGAATLSLGLTGLANVEALAPPRVAESESFRAHEPTSRTRKATHGGRFIGERTFEYILVPLRSGKIELPEVSYSIFDPGRGQYRTLRARPPAIQATGVEEEAVSPSGSPGPNRSGVTLLAEDLRYIKSAPGLLRHRSGRPVEGGWLWLLLVGPPLLATSSLLHSRHRRRLAGDRVYARNLRALRRARRRLKQARSAADQGKSSQALTAIREALLGYVADRAGAPGEQLAIQEAVVLLRERPEGNQTAEALDRLLERCDRALFAGSGGEGSRVEEIQHEADLLLVRLDRLPWTERKGDRP